MALFGTRGGQPFYMAYQATPMPEIKNPTGLAGMASLFGSNTKGGSTSKKEGETDNGETLFPGTNGVIKEINAIDNRSKLIESSYENILTNKLQEMMKTGKGFSDFIKDEDVQSVVKEYQKLEYTKTQLRDVAPISNTDYRQLQAAQKVSEDNNAGNVIAMRRNGDIYMPVQTVGDKDRMHMLSVSEYLNNEMNREDKIKIDDKGIVNYEKSYIPPVINVEGKWQKEVDELGKLAKVSTSGRVGSTLFENQPGNAASQIAYLTHQTGGSNIGALNEASKALKTSMTEDALQSLDEEIHRDIEAGDAVVYNVDKNGKIISDNGQPAVRYLSDEERQDIKKVLTNDFKDDSKEEKEKAYRTYQNVIYNGRAIKIDQRLSVQKQSQSDTTITGKLWDRTTGEGLPKEEGEFYMGVMKNMPPDNAHIEYNADGSIKNIDLEKRPNTFGIVKQPDGTQVKIAIQGSVWNGANSKDVDVRNKTFANLYKTGGVPAINNGRNVVAAESGTIVPGKILKNMKVLATTGMIAERIMPQPNSSGEYEYPVFDESGQNMSSYQNYTKASKGAWEAYYDAYHKNKNLGKDKAIAAAEQAKANYLKNNLPTPVMKAEEYIYTIDEDAYDELTEDEKEKYNIFEMVDPNGEVVKVMKVAVEVSPTLYRLSPNDYSNTIDKTNTGITNYFLNK